MKARFYPNAWWILWQKNRGSQTCSAFKKLGHFKDGFHRNFQDQQNQYHLGDD